MGSRRTASAYPDPYGERPSPRDLYELLRLPALFATITAVVTWLIWYYTNIPCTPELATVIGCNPATIARYINVDIFGRMLTYAAITGTAGGVWNYDMFTKMRAAIAAERSRADEAEKQLAEERQQSEAERRRAEEQRQQDREAFMAALAEERQRSNEERRLLQQRSDEERQRSDEARRQMQQQATENQQAFMAALTEITAQMAHLAQQRNGSNGDTSNGA